MRYDVIQYSKIKKNNEQRKKKNNEGIEACRKALNSSGHLSRSHFKTESICDLMRIILTMNNFEFDNNYYIQLHGTAMGTRMAPCLRKLIYG